MASNKVIQKFNQQRGRRNSYTTALTASWENTCEYVVTCEQKGATSIIFESEKGDSYLNDQACSLPQRPSEIYLSPTNPCLCQTMGSARKVGSMLLQRKKSIVLETYTFHVQFTDINESRSIEVLESDTVALVMDTIIAMEVYPKEKLQIYDLELQVGGRRLSFDDWTKQLVKIVDYRACKTITVRLRKGKEAPFVTEDMSALQVWYLCCEIRKSYQMKLQWEVKLREQKPKLDIILRGVQSDFKSIFIEALDENNNTNALDTTKKGRSYSRNDLHLIVVYCFQDILSKAQRDDFLKAIWKVIYEATGINQKLNALRILSLWIRDFRERDFPHQRTNKLLEIYGQIIDKFDTDDDFKLADFCSIRQDLLTVDELRLGTKRTSIYANNVTGIPKINQPSQDKAHFIYTRCISLFRSLCGGDLANCKHRVRKTKTSIKAMTEFWNETSLVVAFDILQIKNAQPRGKQIDEWIQVAKELLLVLRDYHSASAVVAGLTLSSVYRLKKSWKFANKRNMLPNLKDMLSKNNYCHQRQALKKSLNQDDEAYEKMVIPFLGMIMKDLEKYDQLPKKLKDGSVNKRKYLDVSQCISNVIAQTNFRPSNTVRYGQMWENFEESYKRVKKLQRVNGFCKELDDKANLHVKDGDGSYILCNLGEREKLLCATVLSVLASGSLCVFHIYNMTHRITCMIWHLFWFLVSNGLSCWVTKNTKFEDGDVSNFHKDEEDEKLACSSSKIITYFLDAVGLGILPAFWRARKANRFYENVWCEIDSWTKEFPIQNAISAVGMHLPVLVFFFGSNLLSLELTNTMNFAFLGIPFVSSIFGIFCLFRGAHETVLLVSGPTVSISLIALTTDFLLRVGTWVGLLSHLVKGESLMFQVSAYFLLAGVFLYEIAWVFFFHKEFNKSEESCECAIEYSFNWKIVFVKLLQAIWLSMTFFMTYIPVLGMCRPKYQKYEHYIRILICIAMDLMQIMWERRFIDSLLPIVILFLVPIHIFAYWKLEDVLGGGENHDARKFSRFGDRTFNTERGTKFISTYDDDTIPAFDRSRVRTEGNENPQAGKRRGIARKGSIKVVL